MNAAKDDRSNRAAPGRYDRVRDVREPAGGVAIPPKAQRAGVTRGAVVDPWGDGKQRHQATINRRVDILEQQRSRGDISEGAYLVGRKLQGLLEKLSRTTGSNWEASGSGDPKEARNQKEDRLLDAIVAVEDWERRIIGRIGVRDWYLLRWLIGDRMSFAEAAKRIGWPSEKGEKYVSRRFRDALEDLANAESSRGKIVQPPNDAYLVAAGEMADREAASLATGERQLQLEVELADIQEAAMVAKGRDRAKLLEESYDVEARLLAIKRRTVRELADVRN